MNRQLILSFILLFPISVALNAQEMRLFKGQITDNLTINDSIAESFVLYLPEEFETAGTWPLLMVFDMEGRGKQSLSMFREAAENQGYILAASNKISDSLTITDNVLITNRLLKHILTYLPVNEDRIYTAGFGPGAKMAALTPLFIRSVNGVISCGSSLPNTELLNARNRFHFIGITGDEDFAYTELLQSRKLLNTLKFPNHLLTFEGKHQWPQAKYLDQALRYFNLKSMAKGILARDNGYIQESWANDLKWIDENLKAGNYLKAYWEMEAAIGIYRPLFSTDSLRKRQTELRRNKEYKSAKRRWNAALFKEGLLREDYQFYLEEDLETYNFNNLGWWTYQMGELKKFTESNQAAEQKMGHRLIAYLRALIDDYTDLEESAPAPEMESLKILWMLKTIVAPGDYAPYLKIISESARLEDFGTALFYLEELLKNGYQNREELYGLENTALFRITPEFNSLVSKYLKDARYEIEEQ